KYYLDYLNKTLNRKEKIDLEIHLHTCSNCQQKLKAFHDVILQLTKEFADVDIPKTFMDSVTQKVENTLHERSIKKRKRTKIGIIISTLSLILLCLGLFTNTYSNIYYSWVDWKTNEDEQLRQIYKDGLGVRLNLEVVNNDMKVNIKTVVADEFQTLIYYEIENMSSDKRYLINTFDGVRIKN